MRFVTPALCVFLALAAGGRFHAEAQVRAARTDLSQTRAALAAEAEEEARLRLEVEVLESAGRFEEVNARTLQLRAPEPEQLTTGGDFAETIGWGEAPDPISSDSDVIANAIAMTAPQAAPVEAGQ